MENIAPSPVSLLGQDKLQVLMDCAAQTFETSIEGEVAEVGVYKGGSARLLCSLFPHRPVHLFDTFSGMPFQGQGDIHQVGDFADTSLEEVKAALSESPNAVFHPGLFPATATGLEENKFAFVHIDGDQYQTTLDALNFFYPRLIEGGMMLFDDYEWQSCPGVAQALFDFLEDKPEGIVAFETTQAYFRQGQRGGDLRLLPYPEAAKHFTIDYMGANFTKAHEVQILLWLASQTQGAMVEIGTLAGNTTRLLAQNFSSRLVYGVNALARSHLPVQQAHELPSPDEFCRLSRYLPNVLPICSSGALLNYETLDDVDFIFINGNHSYVGVRAESQRALDYLQSRGRGVLVWHDVFPEQSTWNGVWKFLSELSSAGLSIQRVDKTWLAYTIIGAKAVTLS